MHPDLDGLVGKVSRLTRAGKAWRVKAGPPAKGGKQSGCLVIDVGELPRPLRSVEQVMAAVAASGDTHERRVRSGAVPILLIRYWRGGNAGVLALLGAGRKPLSFSAIAAAHEGDGTLQLRAGLDRATLNEKAAAVIGVGAIGAQVADLLARAGIGALTLVDYDVVRPGNLIRHTAKAADVGHPKVDVVRRQLDAGPASPVVTVRQAMVTTLADATDLLQDHDVVVDATANQTATRLLLDGASTLGRHVVSVCLVREGQVARVDRAPLRAGEAHFPATPEVLPSARLTEGGCGDPISPAPMWAATAAAVRAVGACVDVLTDRNEYPASLLDILVAGDGACGPIGSRS